MLIIHGTKQIKKFTRPVVALGVFDGVHRGHQIILKAAVRKARHIGGTSIALTFWPHPRGEESLYSLEHRLRLIQTIGIQVCIVINFTQRFSRIKAEDFVKDIVFEKFKAYFVYVGRNFRFGYQAKGDLKTLRELSQIYNFKLRSFEVIKINHCPISSTYIRTLIKQGRLDIAKKLLSRPVGVLGTVVRGVSLARRLGFSTANIDPHHEIIPPSAVYAVKVVLDKKILNGICYIGTRPTFKTSDERRATSDETFCNFIRRNDPATRPGFNGHIAHAETAVHI
jgi:riboflavin kinase/FMN adenylyltransferase